jgi:predicted acetyltransferase
METAAVQLVPAEERDAGLLGNLLELYIHDLSAAFDLDVGIDGRFGYAPLACYWREPDRRFPFLIRAEGKPAGFVLATRGSPASPDPAHLDVAEFFVLRRYRRCGVGRQAAIRLWEQLPGHWIVRVASRNAAALPFWARVIADYTRQLFNQEERDVSGKRWTIFSLDSPATPITANGVGIVK